MGEKQQPSEGNTTSVRSAPFGYCPTCGGVGLFRERRPNGNDRCENGHTYPSRDTNCVEPVKSDSSAQIPLVSWLAAMRETLTAIHEVRAAFGAPGDYGYESKEGRALERLYDSTRGLCAEIATNTPAQKEAHE